MIFCCGLCSETLLLSLRIWAKEKMLHSIKIVLRYVVDGLSARAHVFHGDQRPRPTIFDFQEAGVAVGHVVRATNWVVVGRAYLLTASEEKAGDASFHRYHKDVLPAIEDEEFNIQFNSSTSKKVVQLHAFELI